MYGRSSVTERAVQGGGEPRQAGSEGRGECAADLEGK